jgi:lysophospholipase L1-like esterase
MIPIRRRLFSGSGRRNVAAPPPEIGDDWNIVFDGDSLTAGYYSSVPELNYPSQLMAGKLAVWNNVAVPGQRIDELEADAASRVDTLYDEEAGANVCVVLMGANDIIQGWTTQRNYNELAKYCRSRRDAGWRVVLCTLPASDYTGNYLVRRAELNDYINTNSDVLCDAVADLAVSPLVGVDGAQDNATYFNADGLHFADAGFTEIAAIVEPAIIESVYDSGLRNLYKPRMFWEVLREPVLEDLTECSYLADHAGKGVYVYHGTEARWPLVVDDGINGHKSLAFETDDELGNTAGWTAGMSYTKLIVCQMDSLGLNNLFSSAGNHALYFGNSPYSKLMLYHDGAPNFLEGSEDVVPNTPYIFVATYDADTNTGTIFVPSSNVVDVTGAAAADGTLNASVALGGFSGNFFLNGMIAAALAWNRVLTEQEIGDLLIYFGDRYGIEVGVEGLEEASVPSLDFSEANNSQYLTL